MTPFRVRLLAFALIPSLAFGAANQIRIGQTNAGGTAWLDRIFNTAPNSLIGTNASGIPQIVSVGEGLSLVGGELTATGVGAGTVTSASVVTANGVSATIANATTTPAFTFTLGNITPSSVAATGTVTGSNLSGTNTGDQTSVTGNAGTATALATARNINGVAFNGTANITVTAAAGTLTGTTLNSGVTASSLTSAAGGAFGTAAYTNSTAYAAANNGTHTGTTTIARADVTKLNFASSNLGTVTGGGNITLTNTNTIYRVVCSGSTATVVLPSSPPDGRWVIEGNSTYASGRQVITVPALIRPEQDPDSTQASFGIAASSNSYWTAVFTSVNGVFVKFSVDGDDLVTNTATDSNALHSNISGEIAALTAKSTPTTSDKIVGEDQANSSSKVSLTLGSLPVSTPTQTAIDAKIVSGAYGSGWSADTTHAASRKDVYDKIETVATGALFTTEMGVLWPTADLGSKPANWLEAGTGGTPGGGTVGSYTVIVKGDGTVDDPTFNPAAGTYSSSQNVELATTTSGALIRFTTDGGTPTRSSGTEYSTPIPVDADTTIKAIAYKDYSADSSVATGAFVISAPSLSVSSATVASDGNSVTVNFSASVSVGAGGSGGLAATMTAGSSGTSPGSVTLTYASGAPGTALVFNASRSINKSDVETLALAYTQPGNGIEATSGGTDLASFSGQGSTNSSTAQTYTLRETLGSSAANLSLGDVSTNPYVASKSTAAASYVLTKAEVNLLKVGSPGGVITAKMYADSSGAPGSLLASSTNTKAATDVLTTESFIAFLFSGQSVSSSSVYWYAAFSSAVNNTNYYRLRGGASASGTVDSSSDGSTWAGYNNRALNVKTYSSP